MAATKTIEQPMHPVAPEPAPTMATAGTALTLAQRIAEAEKALANKVKASKYAALWTMLPNVPKGQWIEHTPDRIEGQDFGSTLVKVKSAIQRRCTEYHPNEFIVTYDAQGVLIKRVNTAAEVAKLVADQKMERVQAEARRLNEQMEKFQELCQEAENAAAMAQGRQPGKIDIQYAQFRLLPAGGTPPQLAA